VYGPPNESGAVRDGRIVLWRDYFDWLNVIGAVLWGAMSALLPKRS
jgi:Limonene-1,2-epoxide hydrolase catalytic domain